MARAGAKRSKQVADESPTAHSASKKRKTDKKKIAPKKVASDEKMDPYLQGFCEKFKHPEDSMQFLLQNSKMTVDDFFKNHWGNKSLLMEAAEPSEDIAKIFDLDLLKKIIARSENHEFIFVLDRDFTISKMVDGKREEPSVDILTVESLEEYTKNYSVQVNQPQRFQEALWSFMEKLECHLGSLVASHVFFVPNDVQGQPKQYEDTEKFVLQLKGTSSWKLHAPKGVQQTEYNDKVKEEEVGEEILAATLKAGDVLYIPKGVIFESKGVTTGAFIVFSTFQGMSYGSLLNQTITNVIDHLSLTNEHLRRRLPIGYLPRVDSVSNSDYADTLAKLAEGVRSMTTPIHPPGAMINDFMVNRLPPYGQPKFELEAGCHIKLVSKISFRNKMHISWFVRKTEDSEMNEDNMDEDEAAEVDLSAQNELVIHSSMNNDRSNHMMIESRMIGTEGDSFTISVDYKDALEKLYAAEEPITVESLLKKPKDANEFDVTILIRGLHNIGAICVSE